MGDKTTCEIRVGARRSRSDWLCGSTAPTLTPPAPAGTASAADSKVADPALLVSPMASSATASPAPVSLDPEAVREAAASAYPTAARAANNAEKSLVKRLGTFRTLKRARAYVKADAAEEG